MINSDEESRTTKRAGWTEVVLGGLYMPGEMNVGDKER